MIIGALVSLIGIFISGSIGIVLLKCCCAFVLTMVFMMDFMFVDPNAIIKLTVLPIVYVSIMVG